MPDEANGHNFERPQELTCRYRIDEHGGIVHKVFEHPDDIPGNEGWVDSPSKLIEQKHANMVGTGEEALKVNRPMKRGRGRPRKDSYGNGE